MQAGKGTLIIGSGTVDMSGNLTGNVYFSVSNVRVGICSTGLFAGATAPVTSSQVCVFKDTSFQQLAKITSGYFFGVIAYTQTQTRF